VPHNPETRMRVQVPCTLTQSDFDRFADLSGDHNPIHVDPVYAARTAFGATVSHGMLLYTRLRGLMAQQYPGYVQQSQTLMFPAPAYAGEALTLVVEEVAGEAGGIALRVQVKKPDGRLGLEGAARLALASISLPASAAARAIAPSARTVASGLPAFDTLRVRDGAHIARRYRAEDLRVWWALVGQEHLLAEDSVPEPLIAALFSCLLGEKVPGHGTNYLKQSMMFHAAARVDEVLDARVTITRLRPDKALVNLATQCAGEGGRPLCSGEALVRFPC